MDIYLLEKAASIVFAMCREHPEICPHEWIWEWTEGPVAGMRNVHYKCSICGTEKTLTVTEEEYNTGHYY